MIYIDTNGDLRLYEYVSGAPAQRANAAGVCANGQRITIIFENETIKAFTDGALRWTYSSAANFKTETTGQLYSQGTGGAASNLLSWPRFITGPALARLKDYIND